MRAYLSRRWVKVATTLCLALFQVNLLWVVALHRHETLWTSAPHPTAVRRASQAQQRVVENGLLCTTCQIVRHAAARPAPSATAPEARGAVFVLAAFSFSVFHSLRPTTLYGRAPPLT